MPEPTEIRQGANLPHWTRKGATYFITFRTADSLPAHAVERLKAETRLLERKANWQHLSVEELVRVSVLKSEAYLRVLDDCYGDCVLRREDCAQAVMETLLKRNHIDYCLWAWCVMPNHVHAVVEPAGQIELPKILQAWKSVSSRKVGKLLGTSGKFWQPESYDHIVRDEQEFRHFVEYTVQNPVSAGLHGWKWVGKA